MEAKKIFGIVFLIIAGVMGLASIGGLPEAIKGIIFLLSSIEKTDVPDYNKGYVAGQLMAWGTIVLVNILFLILGLRLIRTKQVKPDKLDD